MRSTSKIRQFDFGGCGALQPRKDADTRAAGNDGPIPSFPGNYRSGSQTSRLWSQPMRTRGIQNGEGDVNHERIFSPGGAGVESTAPNFVQARKRVADMKHGFESRLSCSGRGVGVIEGRIAATVRHLGVH